jgi:hypothetical protein
MEMCIYHCMPYIFSNELTANQSLMELTESIACGNHKSATDEFEQVKQLLISKDVTHGFSVPFPASTVTLLPSPVVNPLGLAKQWALDNRDERVLKFRMMQDLSFLSSDPTHAISINKRIDMTSYPEMIYGWCFARTLHFIASLRYHHPLRRILIVKYNFSDAYRRITHSAQAAHQTVSIVNNRAHMALRLTFGGSPNPPTWCAVDEVVTDLINKINHCPQWNHSTIHSPVQTISPAKFLPDQVPISPAFEISTISLTTSFTFSQTPSPTSNEPNMLSPLPSTSRFAPTRDRRTSPLPSPTISRQASRRESPCRSPNCVRMVDQLPNAPSLSPGRQV